MAVLLDLSFFMTVVVWFGARFSRLAGVVMLLDCIALLILEFTTVGGRLRRIIPCNVFSSESILFRILQSDMLVVLVP